MKPFRGKRKRPEIPKGEIQVHSLAPALFAGWPSYPVRLLPSRRSRSPVAWPRGSGGPHFSPSRTSRPVGTRSEAPRLVCSVTALASTPLSPEVTRPTSRRYQTTVSNRSPERPLPGARRVEACHVGLRPAGPPLVCWCPRGGTAFTTPVSGASVSGTYPTRLETRTKKSNMRASHWATNPKA